MSTSDLAVMALAQMPFAGVLGIEIVSGEPDRVEATATWRPEYCTAGGLIHGGYLMGVADSVGALCAFLNLPRDSTTSTIESKTNFFRPVPSGSIRFVATPVNVGRRVIVVQTDACNEEEKLVSRTTQSQAVMAAP